MEHRIVDVVEGGYGDAVTRLDAYGVETGEEAADVGLELVGGESTKGVGGIYEELL